MSNEIIALCFVLANFGLVALSYKLFGRKGLYAYIVMSVIAANIQVAKVTTIFGLTTSLGNTMFSGIFLATDILSENYGKKAAKTAVYLGFFMQLSFLIVTQFSLMFAPHAEDWAQPHMEGLFGIALPVFTLAGLSSFIISQNIDVMIYHKIKERFPGDKWLWLRNNGSTLISQVIDTTTFTAIVVAFGIWPLDVALEIYMVTYLIKGLLSILDTPFIYLMKKIKPLDI